MSRLKELGPSAIDVEIRSLSPEGGGDVELMGHFMKFIEYVLSTNNNFELVQAYLGLFLKVCTNLQLRFHLSASGQSVVNGHLNEPVV